jgi:hypothetical protein
MGMQGMNVYVHAPKDDGYQRASWREPYPPDKLAELLDEVRAAKDAGVDWVPNLSPAVALIPGSPAPGSAPSRDVCFSCPEDHQAIFDKLDPFFDAGTRVLMLSFDDAHKTSSHPQDAAAYGAGEEAYGRMNRDLLNTIHRRYAARDANFKLFTVLVDYAGTHDTPYLQTLRSDGGLDDGIEVMWTGTAVVSATLDTAEAAAYAALVGRERVLVWDNYPVNDFMGGAFGRPARLFMGPYAGRGPGLPEAVSGILANPMSEPVASRVVLGTVARYLNDPSGYDPEAAWRASIRDLAGEHEDALVAFAENSRSSALDRTESPVFVALRDALLDAGPFWLPARDVLNAELAREEGAEQELREALPAFAEEADGFLAALTANARAARAAVDLLVAQRPVLEASLVDGRVAGRASPPSFMDAIVRFVGLQLAHQQALSRWEQMHGDRLAHDLATVYVDENRVDAFVRDAARRTGAWLPAAPVASSGVTVTVDGEPVTLDADGRFTTDAPSAPVEVIATDAAGGTTGLRLALD